MKGNTQMQTDGLADNIREFRNMRRIGLHVTAAVAVAVLMIVCMLVSLFLLFLSKKPNTMMPGLIGGMTVIPFMCITAAVYMLRIPVRIVTCEQGITIDWLIRSRTVPWRDIRSVRFKEANFGEAWFESLGGKKRQRKESLLLCDGEGRSIAEVSPDIEDFPVLVKEIHDRSTAAQGASTFCAGDHAARAVRAQKRTRILMLVTGSILGIVGVALLVMAIIERRDSVQLTRDGELTEAVIARHYMCNITPRIEYTLATPDGKSWTCNVEVERPYWDSLKEGDTVPVRYVPANPKNSALVIGQVEVAPLPFVGEMLLSLGAVAAGCLLILAYVLRIADIRIEDGRLRIVRLGEVEAPTVTASLLEPAEDIITILDLPPLSHSEGHISPSPFQTAAPAAEPAAILPPGIKAIGIINIIFGAIGMGWNLLRVLLAWMLLYSPPEMLENMRFEVNTTWVFLAHGTSLLVSATLLVSGIAILHRRNWGRILAIVAALVKCLMATVEAVMTLMPAEIADPEQRYVMNVTRVLLLAYIILTMVYPAILIFLLGRRSTREVFLRRDDVSGILRI